MKRARRQQGGPHDEEAERIARMVRVGVSVYAACAHLGIADATARYWLRQGARGRWPFALFARAVTEARAAYEAELERAVHGGGADAVQGEIHANQ